MKQRFIINDDLYTAKIWKEHDLFYARCPELGTTSNGKTIKAARLRLTEVTRQHLEEGAQGKEKA